MKNLLEIFSKYTPDENEAAWLRSGTDVRLRADRAQKIVEVKAHFAALIPKKTLYAIEEKIKEAYALRSVRFCPCYDSALFQEEYVSEILEEAKRRGTIIRGFFNEYTANFNGQNLEILVSGTNGGIELMYLGETDRVISDIIREEFGLNFTVSILRNNNFQFDYAEHHRQRFEQIMSNIEKERSSVAPQSADSNAEDSIPLKRVQSLFPGEVEQKKISDTCFQIGYITFDCSSPEPIIGESFSIEEPTAIRDLVKPGMKTIILGQIAGVSENQGFRSTKIHYTVALTDKDSSINIKLSLDEEDTTVKKQLKVGTSVAVLGNTRTDQFDGDICFYPKSILKISEILRQDRAEKKRVELHLHTTMSVMDAVISPEMAISNAANWGHRAIAITDHGNVQAFPEAMKSAKAHGMKVLYGIEGYYVDDTAKAIFGDSNATFADEFCVFDIETTGLSVMNCKITEIGAVRIKNGEIQAEFNTLVNPEEAISEEITKLTGITDEMVKDAPKISEALREFLDFAGDSVLVAHNAGFDTSFIRKAADDCKYEFNNAYLDTVALSRYLIPELKNHKLDTLADHLGLGDFNHHRACDDARMLAMIFAKLIDRLHEEGVYNLEQMVRAMSEKADPLRLKRYHIILLVKNKTGLKNLYQLVSQSYLNYYRYDPRMPKTILEQYREGLIIGSACEAGELYSAILENRSQADIEKIASFYDYLEIQPLSNNRFLIENNRVENEEALKEINRKIVALGDKLSKPVVATCDAHFLNKEDEIYRKILLSGMKYADGDRDIGLYERTTEEMLEEFSYLGKEKAYEVVVTNTNLIADMIDDIQPIPDGTYTPNMEGAEQDLQDICWQRAHDMYGDDLPEIVEQRLNKELGSIIKHGFAVLYMIAQKLVSYSESQGYLVGSRGSVGSSFVATMAGISEVNPLPPHYRCPKCRYSRFITDGSVGSGFDLPDENCPICGEKMLSDGQDIPFETFLGFYGDKSPDIDLNFSGDVQGKVHKYTEELFGADHVFRAGTIGTLADKTAYGFVAKYLEGKGISVNRAEITRLVNHCVGVKRTTGQHPGGIIVVPKEYDIYDFTPVQHPADDPNSNIITTHFQFSYLHDTILKLDELGHDIPTKYKLLEKYTDTSVMDVPMNAPEVYELFASTKPLGISPKDIGGVELGTLGLPEMGTRFIQQVLIDAAPKTFADLMQISGLTHGTNVWLGNAQDLIKAGTCTISEVVGTRDGIMLYLIRHNLENSMAFKIMEDVRKGRGLKPEYEAAMLEHNVPQWYIDSCKKIKYMFPKAHAAAYVMSAIRLGWYKIHYPMEFYAGLFTVAPGGFDAEIVLQGKGHISSVIAEVEKKGTAATQKENEMVSSLQLARECLARGIQFLPIDLQRSDATDFLPENGNIRLPFSSLSGLGENAAQKIIAARKEDSEILSVEELRQRAGLTKTVIEVLTKNGVLDGMSQTNQISLF